MAIPFPEDKEKTFAYLTIHDFFDVYLMSDALMFLQTILRAANTKKVWKHTFPFRLLNYMQQLDKLSSAAFSIHDNHYQRDTAIIEDPGQKINAAELLQACIGSKRGDTAWSCFPRSLTPQQFYDPYKAIGKYCQYLTETEWKKAFAELQEYALAPSPIHECYPTYNILKLQKLLSQLIEACHLLHVRTNIPMKKEKEKKESAA